jgi:hypothetical protein
MATKCIAESFVLWLLMHEAHVSMYGGFIDGGMMLMMNRFLWL